MVVAALTLKSSSTGVVRFGVVDQVAIVGLGPGRSAPGCSRWAARGWTPTPTASGSATSPWAHELPWTAVRAVRVRPEVPVGVAGAPATATRSRCLAVQAVDGERAVRAVEGLRALLAAGQAAEPARPPLLYDN